MTTENLAAPGAAAELPAPDSTEVETPQLDAEQTPAEATPEPETEAEKEAKALKAMQRRIDKRTRDLYAERAQREQLEREVAALRNTGEQTREIDASDVETLATRRAQELVEQQTLQSKVRDVLAKGAKLEGFDSAVNTAIEDLGLLDGRGKPTPYLSAIFESDAPHEVLHYLGTNPEAADSLQGLTPTQFARRLARIETQMQEAKQPKRSNAPQPLKTVAPQASTSELSADLPIDEWMRRRTEQVRQRGH